MCSQQAVLNAFVCVCEFFLQFIVIFITVKKPLSSKTRPSTAKATTKTPAPSMTDKSAGAKLKVDRSKKQEEQEAERKKRLVDKQAKDHERVRMAEKRKTMEEKRRAMEEKRKTMEEKRKDIARKVSMKDKVASGTSSARAVSKPSMKESSVTMGAKSAAPRSVCATDGAKAQSDNKTALSSASSKALATEKATPGLATSTSAVPKGISNGTATAPGRISKPVTHTTSKLVPSSTKRSSKAIPTSSRPLSSRVASSNPQGVKVTSKVALSSPRPQSARTYGAATATTTNKVMPTKQVRPPTSTRLVTNPTNAPSKSVTRVKTTTPGTSSTKVARPPTSTSHTGISRAGKVPTTSSSSLRVAPASKTTGSGRGTATSVGVKKSVDVTKSPSRIPKTFAKTTTKTTITKPASANSPKVSTKLVSKPSPKVSGSRFTSTTGKRQDVKKTIKLSIREDESVDTPTSKTGLMLDPGKESDDLLVSDVIGAESCVMPDKNGVDELPVTSVPTGSDVTSPSPPVVDSSALSDTPVLFTQATAQRAGQIISLQTSLSKELQSKLPRLGDVLDSAEGSGEDENLVQREKKPNIENELKYDDVNGQLEDCMGLSKSGYSEVTVNRSDVIVEAIVEEEEREERKRVCFR